MPRDTDLFRFQHAKDNVAWYNVAWYRVARYKEEPRHSGIGLLPPAAIERRRETLNAAYIAHPERFVRPPPQPLLVPAEVWINKPQPPVNIPQLICDAKCLKSPPVAGVDTNNQGTLALVAAADRKAGVFLRSVDMHRYAEAEETVINALKGFGDGGIVEVILVDNHSHLACTRHGATSDDTHFFDEVGLQASVQPAMPPAMPLAMPLAPKRRTLVTLLFSATNDARMGADIRLVLILVVGLVAVVVAVRFYGARRWRNETASLVSRLDAGREAVRPVVVDFTELETLPVPVQRYLRPVLRPGAQLLAGARLQPTGTMNMSEDGEHWRPFIVEQLVVTRRPGSPASRSRSTTRLPPAGAWPRAN